MRLILTECHWFPFLKSTARISGSRSPARFLVDDGASMMLASTMVPIPQPQSLRLQVGVDLIEQPFAQFVALQEVAEVQDGGLVRQSLRQTQTREPPDRFGLV